MEKFRKLALSEYLLKAIEEANFTEPSEIQEKTIPLVLRGKDVLGSSATGSGKTLAFGAGIIEKTKKGGGIQSLILTPTRELAEQVAHSLRRFSQHSKLNVKEIYGGVSIEPQIRALVEAEIVVGTPGRVLDHLERRTINLSKVKFLVLDEADRMLDMGFINDVEKIISSCPKDRQTLLFSATVSSDIERLSKKYMRDPVSVSVDSYVDPSKLAQVYYDVPQHLKFSILVHLLKQERGGLVMVFCNTRQNADLVARNLKRYALNALAIHGGLAQNKRTSVLKEFHSRETYILVCTDVAARGLDIKNVSHIYNYDIPKNNVEYIHRVGRTARAGKEGKAISLVSARDYDNFRKVCEDKSLNIKSESVPQVEMLQVNFNRFSDEGRERRYGSSRGDSGRRFGGHSGWRRHGGERRQDGNKRQFRPTRDRRGGFRPRHSGSFRSRGSFSRRR